MEMAEMKILLVCAGGMSTSILMNKMKKYWASIEVPLDVEAVGLAEYNEHYQDFDVILIGPQVSYRQSMIEKKPENPVQQSIQQITLWETAIEYMKRLRHSMKRWKMLNRNQS